MQVGLWSGAAALAAVAVASGVADARRARRRDLDRVGVMPWPGIQMAAILCAVILGALALTG